LFARLQIELNFFQQVHEELNHTTENGLTSYQHIYLEMLEHQRRLLYDMNRRAEFDEDLIRKYLSLIDLEEFKLREKLSQEVESK
jgi:CPA1 family monovalent cation:H+ antiporter